MLTSPISGPERIVTESYLDRPPAINPPFLAWSPDSYWLAMAGAEKLGEVRTLFLLSLVSGEKRRITSPPVGGGDSCPAFSPDGRRLAFSRSSDLYPLDLSVDLNPVAEPKRVTFGNWSAASPAWTADGNSLIFSGFGLEGSSLWRVDASGSSKPHRLATLGDNAAYPAVSPRGNRLAYAQLTVSLPSNVCRIEIPTPGAKAKPPQKSIASTIGEAPPEFSPDGRKVAFVSSRSGSSEIWTCDADGSKLVQLTSLGSPTFVNGAHWSPDSPRLTFGAETEGLEEVYVTNASGGSPRCLTSSTHRLGNA